MASKFLVYTCDWLPPNVGAVGRRAMLKSHQWAERGGCSVILHLDNLGAAHDEDPLPGAAAANAIR